MVPILARQSVIIKSGNDTSIILGNYECAYCLGLLAKAAGLEERDEYSDMTEWFNDVMQNLEEFKTDDTRLAQVFRMMQLLEPESKIDDQVRELYRMGYQETRMWQL